jgi:hypothetical protein
MVVLLELLVVILVFFGLYFLLTEFIVLPTVQSKKAINFLVQEKISLSDQFVIPLANRLEHSIQLDNIRKATLKTKLYSAELNCTPEYYVARAIATGLIFVIGAIPCFIISPIISVACIMLGIMVYFHEIGQVDEIIKKKRESIEGELVLFVTTIKQSLTTSRDVLHILNNFRKICSDNFRKELDITIADMKTGSYEDALKRFEERISSAELSEIVSGLQAVMRGDDQTVYFEILAHDLMAKNRERLKREAIHRPEKMQPISYLMMFCFMAMFIYGIIMQVYDTMKNLF